MKISDYVKSNVHKYYWENDYNCATTTLKILADHFKATLHEQTLDAAIGLHGAGEYGAQCGLVEGSIMFLGILGKNNNLQKETIIKLCYKFAECFEQQFGSLLCNILRPQGFKPENPPHPCEDLTSRGITFSINYIHENLNQQTRTT